MGFGIFALSVFSGWYLGKYGNPLEKAIIAHVGPVAGWRFGYLLVGIISLIVWLTL